MSLRRRTQSWQNFSGIARAAACTSCPAELVPGVVSGTRCFLRFLHLQGLIPLALEQTLPPVAHPAAAPPPPYLTPTQLEQLLAAPDRRQAAGRRDYAILVCLARWGLRARELVQLRLQDLDWHQSTVSLPQSKSRRARQLPLLQPVGQALVAYLPSALTINNTRLVLS